MTEIIYSLDQKNTNDLDNYLRTKGYIIIKGDIVTQRGRGDLLGSVHKKGEDIQIIIADSGSPLEKEIITFINKH